MTGDPDLAKELAQETVVRICRDWRRVEHMSAPGAWAHRVAVNLARSHARSLVVRRRVHAGLASEFDSPPATPDLDEALAVREAVAALPERQRTAVVLRYFADLSVRETASAMRCPEGTVKTLTYEAIRQLRAQGVLDSDAPKEASDDVV
jgi:RNA polymerase sigma factor (sigma-70 family)